MNNTTSPEQLHQYWREHITAYQDSGETGAAYCERRQLVYHRFIYWRKKIRNQESHNKLGSSESVEFIRVSANQSHSSRGLSLALPNGLVIQEINETNFSVVRQLLAVL